MIPSPSSAAAGLALRTFARHFFGLLGAPIVERDPDLWQVDLTPDQRKMLEPPSFLPLWLFDPSPSDTVRWWIAFTPQAAQRHPEAKLLTPHSHLFSQMEDACRRHGLVFTGTVWEADAALYRPWLWLHVRRTRRWELLETMMEAWGFDLCTGSIRRGLPPAGAALRPGMPPASARVERIRLTPDDVRTALEEVICRDEVSRSLAWAEAGLDRFYEEAAEINAYFDALTHAEEAGDAASLEEERSRRLEEAKGRLLPRVIVEPVAAALLYIPYP